MPIGFEFGFSRQLDVVRTRPDWWEQPLFDLRRFIAAVNAMKASVPALNVEGRQHRLSPQGEFPVVLLRESGDGYALGLANPSADARAEVDTGALAVALRDYETPRDLTPGRRPVDLFAADRLAIAPQEFRVLAGRTKAQ
jgi:starch synthase (maltosyl-transferring)